MTNQVRYNVAHREDREVAMRKPQRVKSKTKIAMLKPQLVKMKGGYLNNAYIVLFLALSSLLLRFYFNFLRKRMIGLF